MAQSGQNGKPKKPAEPQANFGVPMGLAAEIERFIEQHPEFGIKFRGEFFHFAGAHYLDVLKSRVIKSLIVDAAKEGRHEHVEKLLKAVQALDKSDR